MLGKVFKIASLALLGAAVCLLVAAVVCLRAKADAFVYLFIATFGAGVTSVACNIAATLAGWYSERYDAFIAKLAVILKITAVVLFCAAVLLAAIGVSCATSQLEAGGWLLICAWLAVVLAGLSAAVAIVLGKSSTPQKVKKLFFLATPYMIALAIIGLLVFLGGLVFYAWVYVFALFM